MLVLITYDINTGTAAGRRRLARVAKVCRNHGQRVQNSVFECALDPAQLLRMKDQIAKIVDPATDSIRYYNLGAAGQHRVEHFGAKQSYDPDGLLIV